MKRRATCSEHDWQRLFLEPGKSDVLQKEYSWGQPYPYSQVYRCRRCERVARLRKTARISANKRGLEEHMEAKVLSRKTEVWLLARAHTYNDAVREERTKKPVDLIFGKAVCILGFSDVRTKAADVLVEEPDEMAPRSKRQFPKTAQDIDFRAKEDLNHIARWNRDSEEAPPTTADRS